MADPIPRAAADSSAAAAVAPVGNGGAGAMPAPGGSAKDTAPRFGGLRGGRKRADGLVPGSPEAVEADRKKDADRKKKQRAQEPSPLPSINRPTNEGAPSAPGDGLGTLPGAQGAAFVPWAPDTLKPVFEQLLPAIEQVTVHQVTVRAAKARLPGEIVKEFGADAKWSGPARKALELSAPQLSAKWLNKLGVSADNQPEIVFATAVTSILASHVLLLRRLDKLIAVANVPVKAPEAKPNGAPTPGSRS